MRRFLPFHIHHRSKMQFLNKMFTSNKSEDSNPKQQEQQQFYKPGEKSHFKPELQGQLLPPLNDCQFRFQLLSDVHLEFIVPSSSDNNNRETTTAPFDITKYFKFEKHEVLAENLVLAGDIGLFSDEGNQYQTLESFLVYCCSIFRRVFYVLGNHEAYNSSLAEADRKVRALANNEHKIPNRNLIYMNRDTCDISGTNIRVLGCTLWSQLEEFGKSSLNDFNKIADMNPEKMQALFEQDKKWLLQESMRAEKERKKVLIITHHAPCKLQGTTPEENYEWETKRGICGSPLVPNEFSSEKTPAVKLMVFGHTHWSCSFSSGGIGIAANQVGYPNDIFKKIPTYVPHDKKRVYGI